MERHHTCIIGGTRGSGRALVELLSEENFLLSVIGRRKPSEKDQGLANVNYWQADLNDQKSFLKVFDAIIKKNGAIKNLVFFQRYRGKGDDWEGELSVSLTATKNIIEYFASESKGSDGRSVVVISSIANHFIADEQPVSYHVAKAGLNQMVRYYAVILGPKGIRVNSISPGIVVKDENREFFLRNEKLVKLYEKITPLGRMGCAKDIANAASFLCSSKASFITGQDIIIDGGVSLQWQETLARKLTPLKDLNIIRSNSGQ